MSLKLEKKKTHIKRIYIKKNDISLSKNPLKSKKKVRSGDRLFNILFNNFNDIDYLLKKLKSYVTNNDNEVKFDKYIDDFIPFDKKKQGYSGASVGFLKNDNNKIIKFFYYNPLKEIDKLITKDTSNKCILVNYTFNEIIINLIINNIRFISSKITKNEINLIKEHVLLMTDYGFSEKGSYIITPKIGFTYNDKMLTNLLDIVFNNHIPILKELIKNDEMEIIELYNRFMIYLFEDYIRVIKLLHKYINYVNTDVKLNNVFVRKSDNKNPQFEKLRQYGFLIDFVLLLSDMDKSFCYINKNIKIMANSDISKLKKAGFFLFNMNMINNIRFKCDYNFNKKCNHLSIKNLDLFFLITDFYSVYYDALKIDHNNNYFTLLNNYFDHKLNITTNKFNQLLEIIKQSVFLYYYKTRATHIYRVLYRLCSLKD
jgi:hypothetical protein